MSPQEVAQVVTKIQVGDNRQVDRLVLAEWVDAIGHLQYGDAIEAVRLHRKESTEYLQPAHVIAGAKRVRQSRNAAPEIGAPLGTGSPAPLNMRAMTRAAKAGDWDEFRRQAAIYNRQLVDAGYPIDTRYPVAEDVNA